MVRRGQPPAEGRWTLPGGRVEPGERLVEAVRREVREETRLEVEVDGLVGHHEVITDDHHFVILDFHARVTDEQPPRAGSDVAEAAYLGRAALVAAGPTDGLLDFLDSHGVDLAP